MDFKEYKFTIKGPPAGVSPYFTFIRSLIRNLPGPDIMTTGWSSYRAINDVGSTPSSNELKQDSGHIFDWDDIKKMV